jgi:hypothetical protein
VIVGVGGLPVFFVRQCVDDLEVLDVIVGVGAEGEFHAVGFLHADQEFGVFRAQPFEDRGVDVDAERILLAVLAGLETAGDGGLDCIRNSRIAYPNVY